ncbi:CoA-disulfide reductase [Vagococcus penaei]|uniref:CoA-disulfide reductase n=1 Tax=Vagococcus penaei TaxID=633807 RepID=A0A1Q2D5P1_9ENTE|nr:FAD-dependent oxidoreductase [Vagococcus penaei]AQP53718.1 CoA-disulfide reductase [Vagococcus penaei]RST99466.1 CoA-disulfide reductase [Vagococcus penaei]
MGQKVLIIGGVAGGMSAATRLRRLDETAEVIIIEKGPYVSFANCGLPYYVSGEISERSDLLVQTPESLKSRFNLDVRPNHEVIAINPEKKTVTIKHGATEFDETYDKLILSPGAKPFIPPIKGLNEAKDVFSLRNVPDLDQIMTSLEANKPKQAVVIGAGFIGLEMAENLQKLGMTVTIIEKAPHVLPPLDEDMAIFVQQELERNHVKVITGQSAAEFRDAGKTIVLEDGSTIATDLTILSVGVQPESSLAQAAGVELGMRGGILVDEYYQTSVPDIYAVGDAIIVNQQITDTEAMIALASPANRQGRQVADIIAGQQRLNKGSIGTAIVRVFDLSAASTGLSERVARQSGLDVEVIHIFGKSHAGYYPGATQLVLKVIFNPTTGKIYGAQSVGEKGVDKRIDIIATATKGDLTMFDLPELEFTYAPPFGSAKDPVNMSGYAAINLIEGVSDSIQWHELSGKLAEGAVLLDVRTDDELKQGRFKDAIHIPLNDLRQRASELDKNQAYIISCHSGQRSYIGERLLKQLGYNVTNLDGGFALYHVVKAEEIVRDGSNQ